MSESKPEPTTAVKCPACGAEPGKPCTSRSFGWRMPKPHRERVPRKEDR